MAHMIPELPPTAHRPGGRAERLVYDALAQGLDDDWFVFHGLHYLNPDSAQEGEADFLLVNRVRGMLVIECKGYGVRRDGEGRWYRADAHGGENFLKESPFEQASRTRYDLLKQLNQALRRMLGNPHRRFPFLVGHSVALPLVQHGDLDLPMDANPDIVMDARDLSQTGVWVDRAMQFWERKEDLDIEPLSVKEFKRFRRTVLYPRYQAVRSLGGDLEANKNVFVQMTRQQCQVIEGLLDNPRINVTGGAGTGKTVLAAHAAKVFAAEGRKVLYLCFTKALSSTVARTLARKGDEDIEVRHFHSLCLAAAGAIGVSPLFPDREDRERSDAFWNTELPARLAEANKAGKVPTYDAIVVDEGQDFPDHWWTLVEGLLIPSDHQHLVIFSDPDQNMFQRGAGSPPTGAIYRLRHNFRNTRQIAAYAASLVGSTSLPHPNCPDGPEPTLLVQAPNPEGIRQVERLLRELTGEEQVKLSDITILTPHSPQNSFLSGVTRLAGFVLSDDPLNHAGKLLHTSVGAFKGLESPVVIAADFDSRDPLCNANTRYVAASRANQVLIMMDRG